MTCRFPDARMGSHHQRIRTATATTAIGYGYGYDSKGLCDLQ